MGLSIVSWTFIHAPIGLEAIPIYLVYGAIFSGLFLWRRSVVPCVVVHVLYDLALLAFG